jgi:hypothetical protein
MNKKSLLKIAFVCVLTIAASSSLALAVDITGTTSIGANATFSPSSNVTLSVDANTANYEVYSQHLSGNRIYYGNNVSPTMYYTNKTAGTNVAETPAATNATNPGGPSGYSSL